MRRVPDQADFDAVADYIVWRSFDGLRNSGRIKNFVAAMYPLTTMVILHAGGLMPGLDDGPIPFVQLAWVAGWAGGFAIYRVLWKPLITFVMWASGVKEPVSAEEG